MRDEFMITRQGKQYVLFAGLLDEAHSRGLRGIDTELIQVPEESNGNTAVVKAMVEMEDGRTFSGIGDASPENVGRNIVPHLIRMAETRAKARALRDAVNVAATALEELSDGDDAPPADHADRSRRKSRFDDRSNLDSGSENQGGSHRSDSSRPVLRDASQSKRQRSREEPAAEEQEADSDERKERSRSGSRSSQKARKSQVDLLRTLAEELRGENGVERLQKRIGKPLTDLTRAEADEWIDRLTPEDRE